jgi:deoxyribonuclease (pyrimidine dimer)
MTRINLVDPKELADQHLVAEYREIFMVGSSLQRSLKSPNWSMGKIPEEFTLNAGHVLFFYNKGKYLYERYDILIEEMKRRGMKPDPARTFKVEQWPDELFGDYTPTPQAINIIRKRLKEKIAMKPNWYRWSTL